MDSMAGLQLPDIERWSERTVVVRGLNPGAFTGPGTNTYLLGTGERRVLLDTGAGVPRYLELLEQALRETCEGATLGDVLLTHVHPDHVGGVRGVLGRFGPRRVWKLPWAERDRPLELQLSPPRSGDVFRSEGATLRAIHTPGHAPDHLCYYLEEEKALFTGDLILGAGTTVVPTDGGDMALYLDSLRRLLDLDLRCIYPGHGPRIAEPHARIRAYLEHRLERERQILHAAASGIDTIAAMVERIYVDTPPALHGAAAQSVRSHLIKLEREGRVRAARSERGERWMAA
jgi:glyoxylase-like metal-dependent hydrolase (beta-lactamase superfamily II)